jgi:hypothetical protein
MTGMLAIVVVGIVASVVAGLCFCRAADKRTPPVIGAVGEDPEDCDA